MKNYLVTFALLLGATQLTAAENLPASSSSAAQPHYLDRYKPVAIWTLDQSPTFDNLSDTSGKLKAKVHGDKKKGLPKHVDGARDFLGKAWDFDGVATSLRSKATGRMQTLGDMENTRGISVSFWMKAPIERLQNQYRLFGHPAVEATMGQKNFGVMGISFGPGYGVNFGHYKPAGPRAFDGKWHHIVATVDFSSRRRNLVMYLDGQEVNRADGAANASFNDSNPCTAFFIGARRNGGHQFSGALDDVAVFDYPLSAAQALGIYTGPVFAGVSQEIYLPDTATLKSTAPEGVAVSWSRKSGKGDVSFADATKANTEATFDIPGEYVLNFTADGFAPQPLKITVHPPSPPRVHAGDPLQIFTTKDSATLAAEVSVPGRVRGKLDGVTLRWKQIGGPGTAHFSDATSATSKVTFDAEGLYKLQLTATHADLSQADVVTVKVGTSTGARSALLLNPLYLLPMDAPANRDSAGIEELAKGTCAEMAGDLERLPLMIEGARPFTGTAWDFAKRDTRIKVHNRFNLSRLGDLERTKGIAISFWIKGDAYSRDIGRFGGFEGIELSPHPYSQGVQLQLKGVANPPGVPVHSKHSKLFDKTWHHVVATADFTSHTDNMRLYVDGKLADKKSHRFTESFGTGRTDVTHHWGSRANGGGYYYRGQLDDIAVFDRPLTEAEVAYLYNGPHAAPLDQLERPAPVVNAGNDQTHRLPTRKVQLRGTAQRAGELSYRWELVKGPSTVVFTNPTAAHTEVSFGPLSKEHHNGDYRHYIFRFTARNGSGEIARASSDEVSVVFFHNNTPKTRKLGAVPEPGVHPRILFSPEDLPAMRKRYAIDPYARKAAEILRAHYAEVFAPAKEMGIVYNQLKEGKPNVDVKFVVGDNDTRTYWQGKQWLYGCLAGSAALALMEDDQAKRSELATVLSRATVEHLKYYRPNYPNKLTHDASGGLGLAYDFLAASMSEPQRQPVRKLLSKMTTWRQSLGSAARDARENSTNWLTHHDQIVLAALAIEGEEGDDPGLIEQAKHKLRTFLSQHGLFKSGYPHEGFGYFFMGMESGSLSALALSRRGENLYETTSLYNNALMLFRSMPPAAAFASNHGDTGARVAGHSEPLNWVMRYLWPDDPAVTYFSEKRLQRLISDETDGRTESNTFRLMALLFPVEPRPAGTQAEAAEKLKLPLNYLCPDKGYLNMRSSWADDAVNLVFRCQHDKYNVGHGHADINSFELYANGTTWFLDPGKFQHFSDCHQTILIDGRGGNGSSWAHTWPSLPGHFLEFTETDGLVYGVGDAKAFYDYSASDSSTRGVKLEKVPADEADLIWADFAYGKTREDMPSMASWRALPLAKLLHADGKHLYRYNPVQRAFRTAALVRGKHPYALIVDDYQKDDQPHQYDWIGNFEVGTVEVVSQSERDLILKKKGEADIGNRLLVRVIQADGLSGAPELVNIVIGAIPGNPNTGKEVTQVRVTAKDVVAPNFKVLLYSFSKGAPLPRTEFTANALQVEFEAQKDSFVFEMEADGRTRILEN